MDIIQKIIAFFGALLFLGVVSAPLLQAQPVQFADLEYPYQVNYQQLKNGHQIAYIDEGDGPAIFLIHGLGSYIPAWKKNISALAKEHRVIAIDLPGYGKSAKDVKEYSISFFARTVVELQETLDIPKAVWAGHSMGGQIAMQGALSYPDKISKLVLVAPAGFEKFTDQEGAIMSTFVTPASIQATPDSLIRKTFKQTFYKFPEEAEFMAEDRVAIRGADDFNAYAHAYAGSVQAMLDGPIFDQLSQIVHPALIIFGKEDALIPNRQFHPSLTPQNIAEAGSEKLPDSRLKLVGEAGHFVHFEKPEIVNQDMLDFINDK